MRWGISHCMPCVSDVTLNHQACMLQPQCSSWHTTMQRKPIQDSKEKSSLNVKCFNWRIPVSNHFSGIDFTSVLHGQTVYAIRKWQAPATTWPLALKITRGRGARHTDAFLASYWLRDDVMSVKCFHCFIYRLVIPRSLNCPEGWSGFTKPFSWYCFYCFFSPRIKIGISKVLFYVLYAFYILHYAILKYTDGFYIPHNSTILQ